MKKPETLEELRNIAFAIPDMGMEICKKKGKKEKNGYVEANFIFEKLYSIVDGRVVFYLKGNGYMIPYFIGIREIFENAGYEESYLQPFFTKEEIPADKDLSKQWKALENAVNEFHFPYRRNYILTITKAQPLTYELRQKALEIPPEGFRAYHITDGIIDVLPCVQQINKLKRQDYSKLGTYKVMDNIAVVVSVEAETYLMRMKDDVKMKLQALGYKENIKLKHPMDGVEMFLDERIQKQYQGL